MKQEREVIAYLNYYWDFIATLSEGAVKKINYVLDILATRQRVSDKFMKHIRDGVYEIRAEYEGNIYRVFFCFDKGNVVILFNGFQKKSQKTPEREIKKALQLKDEYYGSKK